MGFIMFMVMAFAGIAFLVFCDNDGKDKKFDRAIYELKLKNDVQDFAVNDLINTYDEFENKRLITNEFKDFRFIETEYESAQKVMTKLLEQKNKAAEKIIALKKKTMSLSEQDEEYQNIEASIKYEENLIEKYSSQIKQYDSWMKELEKEYRELYLKVLNKNDDNNKKIVDEYNKKEKTRTKKAIGCFFCSVLIVGIIYFPIIYFVPSLTKYFTISQIGISIISLYYILCGLKDAAKEIFGFNTIMHFFLLICLLFLSLAIILDENRHVMEVLMCFANIFISAFSIPLFFSISPDYSEIAVDKANKFENYTNKLIQKSKEISHNKGLLYYKKKKSELINKIEELNTNSIELNDAIEEIDKKISNADLNDIKGFKSEKQNIVSNIMDNTNSIIDRKKWLSYYNTQYLELLEKTKGLVKSEV